MTYVMSKKQYRFFQNEFGMNNSEILAEVNRARGLRGHFKRIVLEG